ncbi:MAG: hypothetical protein JXL85_03870 [Bacilli bacterium]|nr:hypothetical protein [Bacilli bacterium]
MGSSGTGRFGGYSGKEREKNQCEDFDEGIRLEEVSSSEFFLNNNCFPDIDTEVVIKDELVEKRVAIMETETSLVIGFLPIDFNYLYEKCMKSGQKFYGNVSNTGFKPIPFILIELHG